MNKQKKKPPTQHAQERYLYMQLSPAILLQFAEALDTPLHIDDVVSSTSTNRNPSSWTKLGGKELRTEAPYYLRPNEYNVY